MRLILALCVGLTATVGAQIQVHTTGNTVSLPVCNGALEALRFTGTTFECGAIAVPSGGGSIPSGAILIMDSAPCPAGFTEVSALAGKTLIGTLAASLDVGTTGGSDTLTPAGSVSAPSLTLNSLTPAGSVSAPSLTMNSYTPAGTLSGVTVSAHTGANVTSVFTGTALGTHAHELPFQIPTTTTTRQIAAATFGTGTARAATAVSANGTANTTSAAVALSQAVSAGTPAGTIVNTVTQPSAHTVGQGTFTGTAATLTGTITAPSFTGTPVTPTGSVSAPTFTGQPSDNRQAFTRVIFCRAT